MNYDKDIKIEETALDLECLEQPHLMIKYTNHLAEMQKLQDEAEQQLDIVKAEVDKDIRENPEKYEIFKVTEPAVKGAIENSRRYQKVYTAWIEAKYEAKMAQGAVTAFEHRKNMLEALIKLHGQQYFAGPNVPRDIHGEREQRKRWDKEVSAGISEKLNAGRRRRTV